MGANKWWIGYQSVLLTKWCQQASSLFQKQTLNETCFGRLLYCLEGSDHVKFYVSIISWQLIIIKLWFKINTYKSIGRGRLSDSEMHFIFNNLIWQLPHNQGRKRLAFLPGLVIFELQLSKGVFKVLPSSFGESLHSAIRHNDRPPCSRSP